MMLEILTVFCLAWLIYIYLGYPLCVVFLSKLNSSVLKKDQVVKKVTILISAYNEEDHIGNTISNKLSLDYPEDKLEIIVVSDESTDRTDEIVRGFSDPRIKFFRQEPRQGKTSALNLAISYTRGEIIVFSDANSIYASKALLELVSNFADEGVGYVTGKMLYSNPDGSLVGDGCSSYMRYENLLRKYESLVGSVVGVDGGIDAMRKDLYQQMNPDQLPDFVQPLYVVRRGYRVVFEPNAVLYEDALNATTSEYRMRVRVTLRALWALLDLKELFNPFKYSLYSWQLLSHKLLRYLGWLPLLCLLIVSPFIYNINSVYGILVGCELFFYFLALAGYFLQNKKNTPLIFGAPYYFVLINYAALHAFIKFIKGEKQVIWTPRTG